MNAARSRFRAALLVASLVTLAGCQSPAAIEPVTVNFDYIRNLAATAAAAPYQPAPKDLPPDLAALGYDDYRNIRFRPTQALWRDDGGPFQLQFFHRGGLFPEKVTIREFSPTHEQVIPFVSDFFNYELKKFPGGLHSSLGYAGFRVHTPLNRPEVYDEVIAFLGASYFRAIGAHQVYGLSARGLAVDCGLPDHVEEFPRFTDFWVGKPAAGQTDLTIYALLQGPSVVGAYQFVVRPGATTTVDVRAELHFRRDVALAGIAPLTSMFWYGENSPHPAGQVRQEVHDSDGLLIQDGAGGQVWRPLRNPAKPEFSDFPVTDLARVGLLQRDRRISAYEDLEAHYERRPSAWIEPLGYWGAGAVRLVQLPTATEFGDNIVAFWVPAEKPRAGTPVTFAYRILWSLDEPPGAEIARVVATREGVRPNGVPGRLFWIDFADASAATRDPRLLRAEIETSAGLKIRHRSIEPYPEIGGWRVAIETEAIPPGAGVDLTCRLFTGAKPFSETWNYQWKP